MRYNNKYVLKVSSLVIIGYKKDRAKLLGYCSPLYFLVLIIRKGLR